MIAEDKQIIGLVEIHLHHGVSSMRSLSLPLLRGSSRRREARGVMVGVSPGHVHRVFYAPFGTLCTVGI